MSTSTQDGTQDAGHDPDRGASADAMNAVRRLMDERRRFEGWLETLESRREATPERVYLRVRGDYESRLDGVIAELRGHADMLRTAVTELSARAQSLRASEDARREERAEGELRALVGEHTPEKWAEISSAADAEIERLSSERGDVTAELMRVQDMLAQTEAPRTPAAGSPTVADTPVAEAPAAEAPAAEPEPAAAEPAETVAVNPDADAPLPPADAAPLADIDALTFDREGEAEPDAIRASASAAPAEVPPVAPAAPAEPERPRFEPFSQEAIAARPSPTASPAVNLLGDSMAFDELAFLKSVVGPRGTSSGGSDSGQRSPTVAAVEDRATRGQSSTPAGFGEAAKTLRCGDCGTMNAPTEWYCERCGGELAAL